jgi:hypothetical protein
MAILQDPTAKWRFEHFGDVEHYPEETLSPYQESSR